MSNPTQTARLARIRTKTRTDLWPDPPQINQTLTRRFPELKQFNIDMLLWVERLRNANEAAPEDVAQGVCAKT